MKKTEYTSPNTEVFEIETQSVIAVSTYGDYGSAGGEIYDEEITDW